MPVHPFTDFCVNPSSERHPHLSAEAESEDIPSKESDNPLPSRERRLTPSPLMGEGWDGGETLADY